MKVFSRDLERVIEVDFLNKKIYECDFYNVDAPKKEVELDANLLNKIIAFSKARRRLDNRKVAWYKAVSCTMIIVWTSPIFISTVLSGAFHSLIRQNPLLLDSYYTYEKVDELKESDGRAYVKYTPVNIKYHFPKTKMYGKTETNLTVYTDWKKKDDKYERQAYVCIVGGSEDYKQSLSDNISSLSIKILEDTNIYIDHVETEYALNLTEEELMGENNAVINYSYYNEIINTETIDDNYSDIRKFIRNSLFIASILYSGLLIGFLLDVENKAVDKFERQAVKYDVDRSRITDEILKLVPKQ